MAIAPLPPHHREIVTERYVLAADLGQSTDPTALCAIRHRKFQNMSPQGKVSEAGDTFDVRFLQRLPLGLSYVDQVSEISRYLARPPLNVPSTILAVDETGVGKPVCDLVEDAGLKPIRVTITAGLTQTAIGKYRFHVPKQILISALDARLHTGDLRFAAELTEAGAMAEELRDFRRRVTAAGRNQYESRVGRHDDMVLATSIALWACLQPKPAYPMVGRWTFTPKEKATT